MERMQVSPSGVILRLGAGLWPEVAPGLVVSVHFTCIPIPSAPPTVADADFFFDSPFSSILHESRLEQEREVRRMMIQVVGDLIIPDDIHFFIRVFCDYIDVLESFYLQSYSNGHLYISVLFQIPAAANVAAADADAATAGADAADAAATGDPPLRSHLPHAIISPSDEPSRSRLNLPDIVLDPFNYLQEFFPEVPLPPDNWGGGDPSVDAGNNPASASAVPQHEIVFFGAANCRETSCAICIDDFKPTSALSVMPCGHGFHSGCLDEWLTRSNSCPLCRRSSLPAAN